MIQDYAALVRLPNKQIVCMKSEDCYLSNAELAVCEQADPLHLRLFHLLYLLSSTKKYNQLGYIRESAERL